MATTIEFYDTTGAAYQLAGGPAGPTDYVQASGTAPGVRGVGDLWVDRGTAVASWDSGWTVPTLLNGWVNYGDIYQTVRFRKTLGGLVIIEGLVKNGTAPGVIFNLPPGYRTTNWGIFNTCGTSMPTTPSRINVGTAVEISGNPGNGWQSVCLSFYADA